MKKASISNEYLGNDIKFEEWKDLVEENGWLCRDDKDCVWYDLSLGCNDREFSLSNVTVSTRYKTI